MSIPFKTSKTANAPAWGAVFAMSLCVFVLIASEFMPVSLLTPIASELVMTEGQAGQAIAISGIFAVLASLCIARLARAWDRKHILLFLTLCMGMSGVLVSAAPNAVVFMLGRALLGIVIGGFWGLSTAVVMQLVPPASVSRALAMLNGGNALAVVIAAPVGSYLGDFIGWRGVFFTVVPLALLALCWLWSSLPNLPAKRDARGGNVFRLLKNPTVAFGMAAILFLFMGQFSLYTYLRPFLEQVTGVSIGRLSTVLFVIGVAGILGTMLIGRFLDKSVIIVNCIIPLLLGVVTLGLIAYGQNLFATVFLLALWGLITTPAPVGWGTWLSQTLPEDADTGGGLMVATIQFAITLGAGLGGMLVDRFGYAATFSCSVLFFYLSSICVFLSFRARIVQLIKPTE